MLEFIEIKQTQEESNVQFSDSLNSKIQSKLSNSDSVLSVKYDKIVVDNIPLSSVLLTVKKDSKPKLPIDKDLTFIEINEHELPSLELQGKKFDEFLTDFLSEFLTDGDDILSIEYSSYLLNGIIFSSVLLLLNLKNTQN